MCVFVLRTCREAKTSRYSAGGRVRSCPCICQVQVRAFNRLYYLSAKIVQLVKHLYLTAPFDRVSGLLSNGAGAPDVSATLFCVCCTSVMIMTLSDVQKTNIPLHTIFFFFFLSFLNKNLIFLSHSKHTHSPRNAHSASAEGTDPV